MKEFDGLRWSTAMRWQWKAIIPILGVLLLGLLAFQAIVMAMRIPNGRWIRRKVLRKLGWQWNRWRREAAENPGFARVGRMQKTDSMER